jgi:hypothetical protein
MPYIEKDRRIDLDEGEAPQTEGELNYAITQLCLDYLFDLNPDPGYADYNKIIGVLEGVKLEFYRREVANYEDKKIEENGDVY